MSWWCEGRSTGAGAELGGSALPSMGRLRKVSEAHDSVFFFPDAFTESGKQKQGERSLQGIIEAVCVPLSVVNNGNCI